MIRDNQKSQRIFWSCILPEPLIAKYGLSFAACNFSFNLMSGGAFDKVYSSLPVYVGGEMDSDAFADERFELVYDKLRKRGGVFQKLAVLKEQWTIFRKIPRGASFWLYNLNILNALLFVLLKIFKSSVQLNIIVLDFTPVKKGLGANSVFLRLINMAHGRICLASSPLFKSQNSVVLPGVVPQSKEEIPVISNPKASFLLSGVLLKEISQIELVLRVFAKLPQCELHITGTKGDEALLENYAATYNNIHWHGQLPFAKYLDLMHSVTFQLSTRDINFPENECNFPSKIIEALLHNRAIVSTIHYPQLNGINYFEVPSDEEGLINRIQEICELSKSDMYSYVNQGARVRGIFNTEVWSRQMAKLEAIK